MRLTLEPTTRIVEITTDNGDIVPGRVWQGTTEFGVEVVAVITRVATAVENDQAEFQATLTPQRPGRAAVEAFPMRMVL